ncbi:MAG: hypothetical protein WCF57_23040 [Pyrinomonadaceae bacterium]
MKHYTHIIRYSIVGLLLCGALASSGAMLSVSAQEKNDAAATRPKGERDPFVPYKPTIKAKPNKSIPVPVAPPAIQDRIDGYKSQKLAAMNAQQPAPKATTALLLSEMQVIGIFRTPRGFAAMVEATPIKLSYVVYPGEVFYDGQLVAIEENRLVFRQETRWSDGRRDRKVETKPLRKPNAVVDSLAATRSADGGSNSGSSAPAADSKPNAEEKTAASEKQ